MTSSPPIRTIYPLRAEVQHYVSFMLWKEGLMMSQYLAASEIVQKLKAEILGATAIEYALIAGWPCARHPHGNWTDRR